MGISGGTGDGGEGIKKEGGGEEEEEVNVVKEETIKGENWVGDIEKQEETGQTEGDKWQTEKDINLRHWIK